jgi:hypothetical protein
VTVRSAKSSYDGHHKWITNDGKMSDDESEEQRVPWQDSEAKATLKADILSGKVPPDWKPKQVFATHPELYKPYAKYFGSNLGRLRKSLKEQQDRADEDDAAVRHDLGLFPRSQNDVRGFPRWDGSAAQKLLKQDVSAGKHRELKPKELQQTRDEYKPYPSKVFSDHICQEKTSRLAKSYWMNALKKKEAAKLESKKKKVEAKKKAEAKKKQKKKTDKKS